MNKINALLQRGLKKVWASKSGGVLIYFAFGLPILLGVMALSVDLGRAFILNTELKDFSDAAALAGAAELDGRDGARVAAESAARTGLQGTLVNVQAFSTDGGGAGLAIDQVVFLKSLPADGTDFVASDTATSDAEARFIFVSVANRDVRSGLSRALGVIPDFNTAAKSIAGFNSVVCRIPAMMMCNPLEDNSTPASYGDLLNCNGGVPGTGSDYYGAPVIVGGNIVEQAGWEAHEDCLRGKQVLMKTGGGGGAHYFPGEFGLLDPPTGNQGAKNISILLATAVPDFCISDTADLRTGEAVGPVRAGLNVRFDLYGPGFNKNNPDYMPALNVVKGYQTDPGTCKNTEPPLPDPPVALTYPRDSCFATDTCLQGRFGFGVWNVPATAGVPESEPYWATNHFIPQGVVPPSESAGDDKDYADMTRYEVYRHEIETSNINLASMTQSPGTGAGIPQTHTPGPGENGIPSCYTGGTFYDPINDDPDSTLDDEEVQNLDRRLLRMVVINCVAEGPLNGNENGVTTIGTVEMFFTEAVGGSGNDKIDVWGEMVKIAPPGAKDGAKDIVQLYR